jgi:putative spermidine/putrescine transport system permease protein
VGTEAIGAGRPRRVKVLLHGRHLNGWALLMLPCLVFLALVFFVPLVLMGWRSLTDPSPANYALFIQSSLYRNVLWTTIWTSLVVTVVCFLLGYPYAYMMNVVGPKLAAVLGVLLLLPFWSSFLVRSYAWMVLLQDTGVINQSLIGIGVIDQPIQLMRNSLGVAIGLTHIFLPFMVLPIYAAMRRVDPDLVPAAGTLGAKPLTAFRKVFFPLTLGGVYAGCLLVFVLALGFYITPALLGSPRNAMYSELVVIQISELLNFGAGSALAIVLLIVTVTILWLGTRVVRLDDIFAQESE